MKASTKLFAVLALMCIAGCAREYSLHLRDLEKAILPSALTDHLLFCCIKPQHSPPVCHVASQCTPYLPSPLTTRPLTPPLMTRPLTPLRMMPPLMPLLVMRLLTPLPVAAAVVVTAAARPTPAAALWRTLTLAAAGTPLRAPARRALRSWPLPWTSLASAASARP
jgi:hypothetical protein